MPTALITGISGQDGSFLAELLLAKGYSVAGAVRERARSQDALPSAWRGRVELFDWDMRDQRGMSDVLSRVRPAEIYNFAAYSSGAGMFDEPVAIGDVNGLAVSRLLEAARETVPHARVCQASSSEMFGSPLDSPQVESSPFRPRSPYGAAKLYAHAMIDIHRRRYGQFACSAILYNHESPRRGSGFVTRTVSSTVAKIKVGLASELKLGQLESRRDWGYAGDYVRGMWLMLQQPQADDYLLATGETHSVRELCECAFAHVGLDYRDYVREDPTMYRPTETTQLVGDARKARERLGWIPDVGFRQLIEMMVDHDLERLRNAAAPG
jgi:GDPmannose 4,6-dehydratase